MAERAFAFVPMNPREEKPRKRGLTEIRGPYYDTMGTRRLRDVFETMGPYVDGLKFAGGAFALMERERLAEILALAHEFDVYVSTGGWAEYVLSKGADVFKRYVEECAAIGFDVVELSLGFVTLPQDDLVRLVEDTVKAGVKAKPELGIRFGAGGGEVSAAELAQQGTRDSSWVVARGRACLDAGADIIMIESEGITENVQAWRTDVVSDIVDGLGMNNGSDVNLFVDHSQITQLECLRRGIWGTPNTWGRVLTYRG